MRAVKHDKNNNYQNNAGEEEGKELVNLNADDELKNKLLENVENENFKKSRKNVTAKDEKKDDEALFRYKEGGWGWIVVIACGYCFGVIVSLINDYTLIYDEFDIEYKDKVENHLLYACMYRFIFFSLSN